MTVGTHPKKLVLFSNISGENNCDGVTLIKVLSPHLRFNEGCNYNIYLDGRSPKKKEKMKQ